MARLFIPVFQFSLSIAVRKALKDHVKTKQLSLIANKRKGYYFSNQSSVGCFFGVCVCLLMPHSLDDDDDDDVCFESITRSAPGGQFCFFPSCFATAKFPCFQVNCK